VHPPKPRGERLIKEQRLKSTSDFRRVFNLGKRFRGQAINVYVAPNTMNTNRLGIVVASRYFKQANTRNRIKRLIREAFRKNKEALKTGFDFVIEKNKNAPKAGNLKEYTQDILLLGQKLETLFKQ